MGENTKYLPSESWVSSFIGHDDNFGSNFCIPRQYISFEQADYAVELFQQGCKYSGAIAEAVAVDYLYSILPNLYSATSPWSRRLIDYVQRQQVVLRAICIDSNDYIQHWSNVSDWENESEDKQLCSVLSKYLPRKIWVIEVSVPELFSANQRKIAEIVLNAIKIPTSSRDFSLFVCVRVPGSLFLLQQITTEGIPIFVPIPSRFKVSAHFSPS